MKSTKWNTTQAKKKQKHSEPMVRIAVSRAYGRCQISSRPVWPQPRSRSGWHWSDSSASSHLCGSPELNFIPADQTADTAPQTELDVWSDLEAGGLDPGLTFQVFRRHVTFIRGDD